MGELGAGFRVLDIFCGGNRYRISENVLKERGRFGEIVEALNQRIR
jgi:hypothetical protein